LKLDSLVLHLVVACRNHLSCWSQFQCCPLSIKALLIIDNTWYLAVRLYASRKKGLFLSGLASVPHYYGNAVLTQYSAPYKRADNNFLSVWCTCIIEHCHAPQPLLAITPMLLCVVSSYPTFIVWSQRSDWYHTKETNSSRRSGSSSVALKEVCIHGQDAHHYMELMEATSLIIWDSHDSQFAQTWTFQTKESLAMCNS